MFCGLNGYKYLTHGSYKDWSRSPVSSTASARHDFICYRFLVGDRCHRVSQTKEVWTRILWGLRSNQFPALEGPVGL